MHMKRLIQAVSGVLTALALCVLLYTPAQVSALATRVGFPLNARASVSSVNTNVYLTSGLLLPMFQSSIDQQIPQVMTQTINSIVGQLPQTDQDWASEMAGALLQPSATLLSLQPQAQGLLTTFKLSLYPGDPKPQTLTMLIGFTVINPTTVQVTALPINGQTSLVTGPLTTFTMPIGSLNSVAATPNCGDADLNISLKFPISLGQTTQGDVQIQPATSASAKQPLSTGFPTSATAQPAIDSYIELPSASLAQLGSSIGTMQVSSSISAKNIRLSVQGSDLLLTSDIYWLGIQIGTAVSTVAPGASNGNLIVHVLSTKLQILDGLISFPLNSYNTQIQQMINSEFSGALAGKFTVIQAAIGKNPHLPCAATTSLVLAGALNLN